MDNALVALSDELAGAVERAAKHVVAVHAHPRFSSSGVLWQPGVVVTADHMLRRDDDIRVTLADGRKVTAALAGRDAGTDLAVLKVEAPGGIETAEHPMKAGNLVLAVGRSQDNGASAALGVISNTGGPWHTWRGGRVDSFLRLDVRLYPGSSGAAAVDAGGKFIGMATAGLSRTSALAIPVATIRRVAEEILEKGHVSRGYLGIGLQPVGLPEHLKAELNLADSRALIVLSVEQEAPAGKAGMVIGDILVALDGKPVGDTDDVQAVLGPEYLGKTLRASVVRGGELREVSVVVAERPRRRE